MIYKGFASIYDQLMKDAPYEEWASFIGIAIKRYHPEATSVLDLGCGTGEIAVRLAKQQLSVAGVDLSEDMLTVAQAKAIDNNVNILFVEQDMRELSGFQEPFDVVTICCDSLNYLQTRVDVEQTFKQVYDHTNSDSLFIFDVHSVYKIHEIFANSTFAEQDEEISYIWSSYLGEEENSIEHDLTFFVKDDEVYQRFDELHVQRTFHINEYKEMLEAASFKVVHICADFSLEQEPTATSERIFFIARK
ncbi:class I SAM-dependent DNA methyltransferase [Metabacillus sp. HB246100]